MDYKAYLCLVIIGFQFDFCQSDAVDSIADNLRIVWDVTTNSPTSDPLLPYEGDIILLYEGGVVETDLDWEIYFCAIRILFPTIITEEDPDVGVVFPDSNIIVYHVNGCLHKLKPLQNFTGFFPSIPIFLAYEASDWSVARTDVMPRWYVASSTGTAKIIVSTASESLEFVQPYDTPEKWKRIVQEDQYDPFTPAQRYNLNVASDTGFPSKRVLPTPASALYDDTDHVDISTGDWVVVYTQSYLQQPAEYLAEKLGVLAVDAENTPSDRYIEINSLSETEEIISNIQESYDLQVMTEEKKINISGGARMGTFYGIQTLLSLYSTSSLIPVVQIVDFPRFPYRGMHLDVSRNFVDKLEVLKLLEVMAMYKMNKLHFHLTDDEGWRLDIPTLPELIETGSKRCFSLNEDECLISQLGSGPTTSTSGSGYYTVEDYQDILRFAQARYIEVIPEFDMPGHGYAAIKSMQARYNKFKDTDMEAATEYLLSDFNDTSTYLSAQIYRDNAINPCMESTYRFVRELVQQVKTIHQDIQPLKTFHFGGDEVAEGAWLKSPICNQFVDENPDLVYNVSRLELHRYFAIRVAQIVNDEGLDLGGWEDGLGHDLSPINRTDLPNEKVLVHAWNNIWEQGNGERAYTYANEDYQVVISHATHFYFDHPQEPDPEERGYYWATRFTDTYKTFGYMPDDVYANIDTTRMGVPIDKEEFCAPEERCIPLADDKRSNIIGIQGQLFSETCRTPAQLQSQVYPRIVALAERAWHKSIWEDSKDEEGKAADWEQFANTLAYKELQRLDKLGIAYYIPPPGARITYEDGQYYLEVSVNFPGLPILYSTNNGETWTTIKAGVPTAVDSDQVIQVQVRSADARRSSRIITVGSGPISRASLMDQQGISVMVLLLSSLLLADRLL